MLTFNRSYYLILNEKQMVLIKANIDRNVLFTRVEDFPYLMLYKKFQRTKNDFLFFCKNL